LRIRLYGKLADAIGRELELAELTEQARGDGAIVSFVGLARPESKQGEAIDARVLEHHPTLTRQTLEEIAVACAQKFDVNHVRVVHRCGTVPAGEPIVFAGAASLHRRAAFDATDYLMDRLKTEAVFWKREVGEAGASWIEASEADYADRDRWG
jgi:molybdopterin synthase catalytic subunit